MGRSRGHQHPDHAHGAGQPVHRCAACDPDSTFDVEAAQLEHGFTVIPIVDTDPPWAFTVGLERSVQHPEISISGLPHAFAGELLHALGEQIQSGDALEIHEVRSDIIRGHDVVVREVPRSSYRDRFGTAIGFYGGSDFRMLQLVWNDTAGRFPQDPPAVARVTQEVL
jgi:hypothetical protein